MKSFDINIDCGESYGIWKMGADEELMPIVSTANLALRLSCRRHR